MSENEKKARQLYEILALFNGYWLYSKGSSGQYYYQGSFTFNESGGYFELGNGKGPSTSDSYLRPAVAQSVFNKKEDETGRDLRSEIKALIGTTFKKIEFNHLSFGGTVNNAQFYKFSQGIDYTFYFGLPDESYYCPIKFYFK